MADSSQELLDAVNEIRELLRLLAEPAIAERDKKHRAEIRKLAGKSEPKMKALRLMDGSRSQAAICSESGMLKGNLSTFVKQLSESGLLYADSGKQPKLLISLPTNFFEGGPQG